MTPAEIKDEITETDWSTPLGKTVISPDKLAKFLAEHLNNPKEV